MVYILYKTKIPPKNRATFHENFSKVLKVLEKRGAKNIGVWDIEMGPVSYVLHIWAAENLEAYDKVITNFYNDPGMKGVTEALTALYTDSDRWLLRPAPYSPLQ
jgi:hypothetical protein